MKYEPDIMSISREGEASEEALRDIVGGLKGDSKRDPGDVFWRNYWLELKKKTGNQIRPYKMNIVVFHDNKNNTWMVVPPHVVLYCTKDRSGQHAKQSIFCCKWNPTQKQQERFNLKYVENDKLEEELVKAILSYENWKKRCSEQYQRIVNCINEEHERQLQWSRDFSSLIPEMIL
jgi:hypothetical protein